MLATLTWGSGFESLVAMNNLDVGDSNPRAEEVETGGFLELSG